MKPLLLLVLLIVAACSGASAGQSTQVCSAIVGLGGNRDDFQAMRTAARPEDAYAAIDRMSERTRSAIAALKTISDGPVAIEAKKLAAIEDGLLQILA